MILLHINLYNFELVPNRRNQNKFLRVCMGCYQTLIPYISIGNCNSELIFGVRASLKILYKNMTSFPTISKKIIFVTSSLRYSICNFPYSPNQVSFSRQIRTRVPVHHRHAMTRILILIEKQQATR